MSKICSTCGAALDDNTTLCVICGTQFQMEEVEQIAAAPAPKKSKKGLFIGLGIALALIAALVIFFVFFVSKPTDPLKTQLAVMYKGKAEQVEKLAPQEYWDTLSQKQDVSIDDTIDIYKERSDGLIDMLKDEYGDNFNVTFEVLNERDLSKETLNAIALSLEDRYGMDPDQVSAGKELEYSLYIKGSKGDDEATELRMTVIQYKGNWYQIYTYDSDDEITAYFHIN